MGGPSRRTRQKPPITEGFSPCASRCTYPAWSTNGCPKSESPCCAFWSDSATTSPITRNRPVAGCRAHRDWTDAQTGFLSDLVRLYRGEPVDTTLGGDESYAKLKEVFGERPAYRDIPGLCKAATLAEIEAQGRSLNPGRYVGVAPGETTSDEDFKEKLEAWHEELESLNAAARALESTIAKNVADILNA